MTPGEDRGRYLLPPHESERIFRHQIALSLLRAEPAGGRPAGVLLRGQPGAGKTVLAGRLAGEMGGQPARVDADMFRAFHPSFQQLRADGDLSADELVQADARRWFEMAIEHLADMRADIIAEHVVPDGTLTRLAETGYRIGAALLAVPQAVSRLRVLERYQLAREVTGSGRYVSRPDHDRRYRGLPPVVDALENDQRIAAVYVYGRAVRPVYGNQRQPGGPWQHPAGARAVLEGERDRPWTLAESRAFLSLHASLAARAGPALTADLDDALSLAGPLLHPAASLSPDRPGPEAGIARRDGAGDDWPAAASFPVPLAEAIRQAPGPRQPRRPDRARAPRDGQARRRR